MSACRDAWRGFVSATRLDDVAASARAGPVRVCHAATSPDDPRFTGTILTTCATPDARLIVAAVNALPGLLDALDAAEAEVERLRAASLRWLAAGSTTATPDTEGEPEVPRLLGR